MKNALTICFALCCLKAWHRSVQFPVHISRRGGEELDKRSNPENREEPYNLKIEFNICWLVSKKLPYHSNVEIDTHPVHPLSMLVIVLLKKR